MLIIDDTQNPQTAHIVNSDAEKAGGTGGADISKLFKSASSMRSDARMVTRMLSLGVLGEKQVEDLLRVIPGLAAEAASARKYREFARMMEVLATFAKLEISHWQTFTPRMIAIQTLERREVEQTGGDLDELPPTPDQIAEVREVEFTPGAVAVLEQLNQVMQLSHQESDCG